MLSRSKLLAAAGISALLFTGAGCSSGGGGHAAAGAHGSPRPATSAAGNTGDGQAASPKPDVSGVPRVVARVGDHVITRAQFVKTYTAQFQQMASQAQSSGAKIDQAQLKKRTAAGMVGVELLVQEADRKGLTPSKKDVDQTLAQAAQRNHLKSTRQLMTAMRRQGMSAQEVRSQVGRQLEINQVVAAEGGRTTPTQREMRKYYDGLVAQQKQQAGGKKVRIPSFAQVKPQLEQQLESQKQSAAVQRLVDRLRKHTHVTINL